MKVQNALYSSRVVFGTLNIIGMWFSYFLLSLDPFIDTESEENYIQ